MQSTVFKRNVAKIYLSLVPFVVTFLAFTTGYISYKIYLPIWISNVCLMVMTAWFLGAHIIKNNDIEKRPLVLQAVSTTHLEVKDKSISPGMPVLFTSW